MFKDHEVVRFLSRSDWEAEFLRVSSFLIPALLLATPKWNITVVIVLSMYAGYVVIKNGIPHLGFLDKFLIFCFVFYFLSAVPNFVTEDFRTYILDAPSRHLVAIVLLLGLLHIRQKLKIEAYYWGAAAGAFGALVLACYEYFIVGLERVGGFQFSITYGFLAAALAAVCLCGGFYFRRRRSKALSLLASGAALVAMLMTGTRGAWIAIPPVIIFVLVSLRSRIGSRGILLGMLLALIVSGGTYSYVGSVESRINVAIKEFAALVNDASNVQINPISIRLELWKAAWEVVKQSPLRGMNYAERPHFFSSLVEKGDVLEVREGDLSKNYGHAHNELLEAGASRGIPGMLSTLLLYLTALFYFYKQRKQDIVVSTTGGAFVFSFVIFGLSEAPLLDNSVSVFFLSTLVIFWVASSSPGTSPDGGDYSAVGHSVVKAGAGECGSARYLM